MITPEKPIATLYEPPLVCRETRNPSRQPFSGLYVRALRPLHLRAARRNSTLEFGNVKLDEGVAGRHQQNVLVNQGVDKWVNERFDVGVDEGLQDVNVVQTLRGHATVRDLLNS
ncbi:hypothetical protein L2E82_02662 [Cichorium intybus]|uniref:Uncharacterized protein n=1 Tax=Cichorium intybus TaxID=13427 RepID=A0ACB9H3F9_CICIN|nr:hypothetical protein L2E82_02662 [Cichorium intybus]